jgi:hypothetical protein
MALHIHSTGLQCMLMFERHENGFLNRTTVPAAAELLKMELTADALNIYYCISMVLISTGEFEIHLYVSVYSNTKDAHGPWPMPHTYFPSNKSRRPLLI